MKSSYKVERGEENTAMGKSGEKILIIWAGGETGLLLRPGQGPGQKRLCLKEVAYFFDKEQRKGGMTIYTIQMAKLERS